MFSEPSVVSLSGFCFVIRHSSFVIRHSSFVIRHSSFPQAAFPETGNPLCIKGADFALQVNQFPLHRAVFLPPSTNRVPAPEASRSIETAVAAVLITLFLSSLFLLNSMVLRMLRAGNETATASQVLQARAEQIRMANWLNVTDPAYLPNTVLPQVPATAINLSTLTETISVGSLPVQRCDAARALVHLPARARRHDHLAGRHRRGARRQRLPAIHHHRELDQLGRPAAGALVDHAGFHLGDRPAMKRAAHGIGGFTLVELMVAVALGSVVCAITVTGMLFLQKSYAATEQYALSTADQMRVLDSIAMDLRRATGVAIDNANKSLTLTLPSYYTYDPADTAHRSPLPVLPVVSADALHAAYSAGTNAAVPSVCYRFDPVSRQLQREEFFTDGANTGWQPVASQVTDFPVITPDPVSAQKYTVAVSFTPMFQTLDTPNNNVITLSSTVYLRNPLSGKPAMAPH